MTGNADGKSQDDLSRVVTPEKKNPSSRLCPKCGQGKLDYDGLLNLICPVCHYGEGGCFT